MYHRFTALIAAIILTFVTTDATAIVGGASPSADDTRYDAVGGLSMAKWLGLEPDATNPKEHNWFCTATLIAPDRVLTAAHCMPRWEPGLQPQRGPNGHAVRFRRHRDGTIGSVAAGPASFHHVRIVEYEGALGYDLAIGILAEPVTHIAPIPLLEAGHQGLATNTPITHAGWGKRGPGFDEGPLGICTVADNLARFTGTLSGGHYVDPSFPVRNGGIYFYEAWDPRGPGVGVNMHDSGSPVLIASALDKTLRVIGAAHATGRATSVDGCEGFATHRCETAPFAGPDLGFDFDDLRFDADVYAPGDDVRVHVPIRNHGTTPSGASNLVLWLSPNETWDDGDDFIGGALRVSELEPGGETVIEAIPLMPDLDTGTWFVRLELDASHEVVETIEANNTWYADPYDWHSRPRLAITPRPATDVAFYRATMTQPPLVVASGWVHLARHRDGTATLVLRRLYEQDALAAVDVPLSIPGSLTFDQDGVLFQLDVDETSLTGSTSDGYVITGGLCDPAGELLHLSGAYVGSAESEDGLRFDATMLVTPSGETSLVIPGEEGPLYMAGGLHQTDGAVRTSDAWGGVLEGTTRWDQGRQAFATTAQLTLRSGDSFTVHLLRQGQPDQETEEATDGDPCAEGVCALSLAPETADTVHVTGPAAPVGLDAPGSSGALQGGCAQIPLTPWAAGALVLMLSRRRRRQPPVS